MSSAATFHESLLATSIRDLGLTIAGTGHDPEPTRRLVLHLAERARQLGQVYPAARERAVVIAVTTLVASLAMNHVFRGSYFP